MDIAGHGSKQMLKHSRYIRMEAKRNALEPVMKKRAEASIEENTEENSIGLGISQAS
jgi:hypothetical protein